MKTVVKMTANLLVQIASKVRMEAHNNKEDAGYGGRMDDGGSSAMLSSLKMYQDGFNQIVPEGWEKYIKEIEQNKDPEYQEYLELQRKLTEKGLL